MERAGRVSDTIAADLLKGWCTTELDNGSERKVASSVSSVAILSRRVACLIRGAGAHTHRVVNPNDIIVCDS